jgi:hypothetical protein
VSQTHTLDAATQDESAYRVAGLAHERIVHQDGLLLLVSTASIDEGHAYTCYPVILHERLDGLPAPALGAPPMPAPANGHGAPAPLTTGTGSSWRSRAGR